MVSAIIWARRHWRLLALGAAAALWLGMIAAGAWFLSAEAQKRVDAENRAAEAERQVANLEATALQDAAEIGRLTERLAAEAALADMRLAEAENRRREAENRRREAQTQVNDLRSRLDATPECNCGIGSALSLRLRDNRAEREARARPGS